MGIWEKLFIKALPKILEISFTKIMKLDLTTQALERCWKVKKIRAVWPNFCNEATKFFYDCAKKCEEAKKWYQER